MPGISGRGDRVASTARWMASVRARESGRRDRLFYDPWAEALAGEEGAEWITSHTPESVLPIVIRTRYFDDFLKQITETKNVRQVVLLAAGLDTRAYRLEWPAGVRLFELDRAELLEKKEMLLVRANAQPHCDRRVVRADLTEHWEAALRDSGFDPEQPSAWLIEGILFYLAAEGIERVLTAVSSLASKGSFLGFDVINDAVLTSPLTRSWVEMQAAAGAPWVGTLDSPANFLELRGWRAKLTQAGQPDANHGRWPFPVVPVYMANAPHDWFVTAEKV